MSDKKPTLRLEDNPHRASFEISQEELLELVKLVEKLDPIDYGELPVDESEYLGNVTLGVMNMLEQMQKDAPKNWTITLIASLIKTVGENGILQARLLSATGAPDRAEALLKKMMGKP
ncbi:MAG: hypothetical protein R3194_08710 [Limnobacter sp.]|nr:hypothetical protein [Limnobacter sp.]